MKTYLKLFLIILLSALVSLNSLNGPFLFDDNVSIKGEDQLPQNLHLFFKELNRDGYFSGYMSRFVLRVTYSLNFYIGKFNAFGFHLTNILIHIFNGVLFFFICGRLLVLTPRGKGHLPGRGKNLISLIPFLASLVFILLPVQTETTAYISSRSSSLVTFFYLLGVYFFLVFLCGKQRDLPFSKQFWPLPGILLCVLLGIGTKKTFYTFPIILFSIYYVHAKVSLGLFIKKHKTNVTTALLILSVFLSFRIYVVYQAYQGQKANYNQEYISEFKDGYVNSRPEFVFKKLVYEFFGLGVGYDPSTYPPSTYFLTQVKVVGQYYLVKFFFPFQLNIEPDIQPIRKPGWETLVSVLWILIIFFTAWRLAGLHVLIPFSILWFFTALLPTSSFVPLFDLAAEHRTYIAAPGVAIPLAFFLCYARPCKNYFPVAVKAMAPLAVLICFAALTISRNDVWQTEMGLWEDTVKKSPNLPRPHNNLGDVYNRLDMDQKALREFKESVRLDPGYDTARYNLGTLHLKLGHKEEALREFKIARRLGFEYYEISYNLGVIYGDLGFLDKAMAEYLDALAQEPGHLLARNNLALLYARMGYNQEAIEEYRILLKLKPDFALAHNNLGLAYQNIGKLNEAAEEYRIALKLKPDFTRGRLNLGAAYAAMGKYEEAKKEFNTIIAVNPNYYMARFKLGQVYHLQGHLQEAVGEWEAVLGIEPDFKPARDLLGSLVNTGNR